MSLIITIPFIMAFKVIMGVHYEHIHDKKLVINKVKIPPYKMIYKSANISKHRKPSKNYVRKNL